MKNLITMTAILFFALGLMNAFLIFSPNEQVFARVGFALLFLGIGACFFLLTKAPIFNKKEETKGQKEKKDEKFERIYKEIHETHGAFLKVSEKKLKIANLLFMLVGAFFLSVIGLIFFKDGIELISMYIDAFVGLPFVVLIVTFVILYFASSIKSKYRKQYKATIVKDLITKTNSNLTFSASSIDNGNELIRHYERANLDTLKGIDIGKMLSGVRQYARTSTEDYIEGKLAEGISVKMAEIKLEEVNKTNESTKTEIVFNGLFTHINFVNVCPVEIGIFSNGYSPNKRVTRREGNIVRENWDKVTVYSETPEKAEVFLTDELGTIVSKYIKDTSMKTDILLRGNDVYMRFHETKFFEPVSNDDEQNKRRLHTYYKTLNFIDAFAKELNKTIVEESNEK